MTDGFGAGFNGAFVLVADRGDASALADLGRLGEALRAHPGRGRRVTAVIAAPGGDAALITAHADHESSGRRHQASS